MNDQTLRFRLGLFVVGTGLLLLILVSLFGGLPALFTAQHTYIVILPEAAGVAPGTPVRRSGVPIGEVRRVELDNETGEVRLTIVVRSQHAPRKNEVPVLTRGLFGGDTFLDFLPEPLPDHENSDGEPELKPSREPIPPGAELRGKVQPDVTASLNTLSKMAENFNRLVDPADKTLAEMRVTAKTLGGLGENVNVLLKTNEDKLVQTLDNANTTVSRIGQVLNDDNQRHLSATLKNVRQASDNLDDLAQASEALLKESRETLKEIRGTFAKMDQVMTNLERTTKPLAERGDNIIRNLDEAAERINRILADIHQLLRGLGQEEGTLSRLLSDPTLYHNLDALAGGLAKQLPRLERILKDVEIFADKIARHPETLGVGGVVRPGSGLK